MLQVDVTELNLLCLFLYRTGLPRLPEKRISAVLLFFRLPHLFPAFPLEPLLLLGQPFSFFFLPARIRQAACFLFQPSTFSSPRFL